MRQKIFREYLYLFNSSIRKRELLPVVRNGIFEGWHSRTGMTRSERRKEAIARARGALREHLAGRKAA